MKIAIPRRENIHKTGEDDPLPYYFSNIFKHVYLKRLRMVLSLLKGKKYNRMLDAGVGSGIFLLDLAKKCSCLLGMDIHSNMNLVNDMLSKERVNASLARADICAMPYQDNSIDCLVCLSVAEFIEDIDLAVSEMYRIVKNGGDVIIGAPVSNVVTDWLYVIAGHRNQKEKHRSSHIDIISSLKQKFYINSIITYPYNLPLNCSLFFCVKCIRK